MNYLDNQHRLHLEQVSHCRGRTIALFPGAFRPPHRAHYNTVAELVSQKSIDEIVIIVANRNRHIPGTTKLLDANLALKIWAMYLDKSPLDCSRVRVELAKNSAVKHAIQYFERVGCNDRLIFFAGQKDLDNGNGRFSGIDALSGSKGIPASVYPTPVPALEGGATKLRNLLASGQTARTGFIQCLPDHLSPGQANEIWTLCKHSMHDVSEILCANIRSILSEYGYNIIDQIEAVNSSKKNPVFRAQLQSGTTLIVKSAKDSVKADQLSNGDTLKPKLRLHAEKRMIRHLSRLKQNLVILPDIIFFDNQTKTLALRENCMPEQSLDIAYDRNKVDLSVIENVTRFLAFCHTTRILPEPVWGSQKAELSHWKTILELRTTGLYRLANHNGIQLPSFFLEHLQALKDLSLKATHEAVFHLDCCPKNILTDDAQIEVVSFESSSTTGDPACDFGYFLGHLVWRDMLYSKNVDFKVALELSITTYQEEPLIQWRLIAPRIAAFCGATILLKTIKKFENLSSETNCRCLNKASFLLTKDVENTMSKGDIKRLFFS